jgi:hypothetical protein
MSEHWSIALRRELSEVTAERNRLRDEKAAARFVLEVKVVVFPSLCWDQAVTKAKALLDLGIPVEVRFK